MTVETAAFKIAYVGNGATTSWAFPYPVYAKADLIVIRKPLINSALDVDDEVILTLDTDYTISSADIGDSGGVTVVFTQAYIDDDDLGPPSSDEEMILYRDVIPTQLVDLNNSGKLDVDALEFALDRLATEIISLYQITKLRGIHLHPTMDPFTSDLESEARANQFLAFDGEGNPIVASPLDPTVPVTPFMQTVLDDETNNEAWATLGASLYFFGLIDSADLAEMLDNMDFSVDMQAFLVTANDTAARAALGAKAPITEDFAANGTWTKAADAARVFIEAYAAGGGGGGGARTASATANSGGGGGGGGARKVADIAASALGATETVTVGVGGPGGAGATVNGNAGSNGTAGGNSSFGTHVVAHGGGRGAGGQSAAASGGGGGAGAAGVGGDATTSTGGIAGTNGGRAGGSGIAATDQGSAIGAGGGGGSGNGTAGTAGSDSTGGGAGGGAGGGVSAAPAGTAGGDGGLSVSTTIRSTGGAGGATGTQGAAQPTQGIYGSGTGGGGGGGASAGLAGGGRAGSARGGGGGGGGGAVGGNGGAGGPGGDGFIRVTTFF